MRWNLLFLVLLASSALAHAEGSSRVPIELGLIWVFVLYAFGTMRLWSKAGVGKGLRVAQGLAFAAGIIILLMALLSALDEAVETRFSAHMLQHLLLMQAAAPLLILGLPLYTMGFALPLRWRRGFSRLWKRSPGLQWVWAKLSEPLTAWLLATAVLWLWHAPPLYDAAAENETLHAFEHICLFGSALLFWWPLLHPMGKRRMDSGVATLYLFASMLQGAALGAVLTLAGKPLYPHYARHALASGLDPLRDQQLAGLVMWVPTGVLYLTLIGLFFLRWLAEGEAKAYGPRLERSEP